MDGGGQLTQAFPRPGPALKTVLALVTALGVGLALLVNWAPSLGGAVFGALVCTTDAVVHHWQLWRLVTAGLLTDPQSISPLIFTLIGLYFLSPDLERRWGSWRFARFLIIATASGFALGIVLSLIAPRSVTVFHPPVMFGASAAITATAIAWSKANADMQVRLFFILPVSGRVLLWVTIAFCFLGLVYNGNLSEGAAAPFGGLIAGLLLADSRTSPSALRSIYLRAKLGLLRRRAGHVAGGRLGDPEARPTPEARRKRSGPPLRVVSGGLEDELKKRKPPKDKRYLN